MQRQQRAGQHRVPSALSGVEISPRCWRWTASTRPWPTQTAIAARNGIATDVDGGPISTSRLHDTDVRTTSTCGLYAASIGSTFWFRGNTLNHVKSGSSSIAIFSRYSGGIVDNNTVDDAADAGGKLVKGITTFANNDGRRTPAAASIATTVTVPVAERRT